MQTSFIRSFSGVGALLLALVVVAVALWATGNEHARATLATEVLCLVDQTGSGISDTFPMFEDECEGQGGEVVDWCPNLPGTQSEEDLPCTPAPQCNDGLDNDQDGKTDWSVSGGNGDPGCDTPMDDSEGSDTPPPPPPADQCPNIDGTQETVPEGKIKDNSGNCVDEPVDIGEEGGGSNEEEEDTNSGRSRGGSRRSSNAGEVLGAAVSPVCSEYLQGYIQAGAQNDPTEVAKLETFLNMYEGNNLPVDGVYGPADVAALSAFQAKYAADVLTPWGLTGPTGYVYYTTRKQINTVYCKYEKEFPLTGTQLQEIASFRSQPAREERPAARPAVQTRVEPVIELGAPEPADVKEPPQTESIDLGAQPAGAAAAPATQGWWSRLMGWIFGR